VVSRTADYLHVEVRANGFLYHMVRNIVGALVRVGSGEAEPGWLAELLAGRDRRLGAPTAPAQGLYLAEVHYPAALELPSPAPQPVWRDR
jgi:tRNA pseudouridine38-40 synthase